MKLNPLANYIKQNYSQSKLSVHDKLNELH